MMRESIRLASCTVLFVMLSFFTGAAAAPPRSAPPAGENYQSLTGTQLLNTVKIYTCTEAQLDMLLPELYRRYPDFNSRIRAVAALYRGAPYVSDPLTDEMHNWLPYTQTNCTMYVLYVTALANSRSYRQALNHMRMLHYRRGAVGFKNRYHFTEDRITDPANAYFSEATKKYVENPSCLQKITMKLNRKKGGGYLFGGRLGGWSKKVTLSYIPRQGFKPAMLKKLPEVTGIAFVKKDNWDKGLIVGHEGLLIRGDLYHSSPQKGVCIIKNYVAHAFAGSPWEGIIFFTIHEVKKN